MLSPGWEGYSWRHVVEAESGETEMWVNAYTQLETLARRLSRRGCLGARALALSRASVEAELRSLRLSHDVLVDAKDIYCARLAQVTLESGALRRQTASVETALRDATERLDEAIARAGDRARQDAELMESRERTTAEMMAECERRTEECERRVKENKEDSEKRVKESKEECERRVKESKEECERRVMESTEQCERRVKESTEASLQHIDALRVSHKEDTERLNLQIAQTVKERDAMAAHVERLQRSLEAATAVSRATNVERTTPAKTVGEAATVESTMVESAEETIAELSKKLEKQTRKLDQAAAEAEMLQARLAQNPSEEEAQASALQLDLVLERMQKLSHKIRVANAIPLSLRSEPAKTTSFIV